MTRRWPDTLPRGTQRNGYTLTPESNSIASDMDVPGERRVRRVTRESRDRVSVAFRMNDTEYTAFRAWYRDQVGYSLIGASDSLAGWALTNATVTADAVVGHDGVLVDALVENGATGLHHAEYTITSGVTNGQTVIARAVLKAGGRTAARLAVIGLDTAVRRADFDLSAMTVTSTSDATATIKDLGGGWRRCEVIAALGTGTTDPVVRLSAKDGSNVSYAGSGVAAFDVGGLQARVQTGYDLYLPTDADGTAWGAAGGSAWFLMPLAVGGGVRVVEARMLTPFAATMMSGLHWQMQGEVEVRNA